MMLDMNKIISNALATSSTNKKLRLFGPVPVEHYCTYTKTPSGFVLTPKSKNEWLVIFCDEINLPMNDAYSTQPVIAFLRQLTEQGGFWRTSDLQWISLNRVQFIGACNPPTDAQTVIFLEPSCLAKPRPSL